MPTKAKPKPKRGRPPGGPGYGGRPRGVEMPCGWGCGALLTASEMRKHFTACTKRAARLIHTPSPLSAGTGSPSSS